ncbi:MAG: hypothetical protein Q7O04_04865 [Candidatus Omnitrophota bacterium]|nr:hypothetical protein [Candidatus Omnitrophota bacterium]
MQYKKIILPFRIKSCVLALGAQSKAGFCFAGGGVAYLSDSAGELSDLGNFKKFKKSIKELQKKLKINPKIIACDLHPEYIATKYANERVNSEGLRVKAVQHHEAHVASCIADNNIKGKVIGIAFDGTGFGSDGNIWGGEFFAGGIKGLKRVAHLKYVPMPGGEASIKEPWRMAFSYLYSTYGKNRFAPPAMTGRKWPRSDILRQMIDKKINSPLTSSVGRLFDGISSLIGVCDFAKYEGEAAIRLEKIILAQGRRSFSSASLGTGKLQGKYKFKYVNERGMIIIDWGPVVKGVVKDLKLGVKNPEISIKFHKAVCEMIKEICIILRNKYRIKKVCMSGGVFQNNYLKNSIEPLLKKEGFEVFLHKNVTAHDGSISLGQAVLAGI